MDSVNRLLCPRRSGTMEIIFMARVQAQNPIWILIMDVLAAIQFTASDDFDTQIFDGQNAKGDNFPFLASVILGSYPICGATLYTRSRLFTCCHCLVENSTTTYFTNSTLVLHNPELIHVTIGSIYNDYEQYHDGQNGVAKKLAVHPKCEHSKGGFMYDFGVIEMKIPFDLLDGVVELYTISDEEVDKITVVIMNPYVPCHAMGWGEQEVYSGYTANELVSLNVTLMTPDWCENAIYNKTKDILPPDGLTFKREVQVCAIRNGMIQTLCGGDSGTPLACGTGKVTIIGVSTSVIATACEEDEAPLVYDRLDYAWEWIQDPIPVESEPRSSVPPKRTPKEEPTTHEENPRVQQGEPYNDTPSTSCYTSPLSGILYLTPIHFMIH